MLKKQLLFILFLLTFVSFNADAQIQNGRLRGIVTDENLAVVSGANVVLTNGLSGYRSVSQTDEKGEFVFNNLPLANYALRVEAAGFLSEVISAEIRSNVPLSIDVKLRVAGTNAVVNVARNEELIDKFSTSTETRIDESRIERSANTVRGRGLQKIIANASGATTQNNGLIHIRGVEDGLLYVLDGVPTTDRVDAISASSFDEDDIRSLNVITGNFPAEFGGRSAAVVQIQPKSGIDEKIFGSFATNNGNFRTNDVAGSFGGNIKNKFGIFVSGAASRSDRYLDPVDERNFNNRGRRLNFNFRADWQPTTKDFFIFNLGVNGTNFRVPNDFIQQLNGQNQLQELRDNNQSISWERVWTENTVTNLAFFRRDYSSELFASDFDTPISASQNRRHTRSGIIGSVTKVYKQHTFKFGFEATRITPREFFSFFITDEELAEERDISEEVQEFDADDPFIFNNRRTGSYAAGYIQDNFSPFKNLSISAGLRFDYSSLPRAARQFSPRLGATYFIEKTKTAFRFSFNRLYQPPQIENLLLADSEQARELSPFTLGTGGGATIKPEKVSAFEIGWTQDFFGRVRLDAAYWRRTFRNFGDPNTFFNTTVVFPNSVNRGFATGFDTRLDIPEFKGISGFVTYTNGRIVQFGPINGGLFLTDEFIEIGDGTRFIPDHDQRSVSAFGAIYNHRRSGFWASFGGRYESGVPLEVEEDDLEDLRDEPGADLVNFERRRVKPWSVFDFAVGIDLLRKERVSLKLKFEMQNFTNNRFAYNFGSPFEGTHFGHPRLFSGGLRIVFR